MSATARFLLAVLWAIVIPGAAAAATLHVGGQPVDFIRWAPADPDLLYGFLKPDDRRLDRLRELGEDLVDLVSRDDLTFHADGRITRDTTFIRQFLTAEGVNSYGNMSFWAESFGQVTTVTQARTLLADGRSIPVDPGTVQLTPDSDDDIFTDLFEVVLPMSGLEPGAMAVVRYTVDIPPGARVVPYSWIIRPQAFVPQENVQVTVRWDEGMDPPVVRSGHPDVPCRETAARTITCQGRHLPTFPSDDSVNYADVMPAVVVAEPVTWAELGQGYARLIQGAFSGEAAVRAKLDTLLAGARTDDDKLARLYDFVARQVRYVGLELGHGGQVPRPTATTLDRRFGDCKDKTALFLHLARLAGFKAYPVLTSTSRESVARMAVPAQSYFNHVVACVRLNEGREQCADLTASDAAFWDSRLTLDGAIRLDLKPGVTGPSRFKRIQPRFRRKIDIRVILHPDGTVTEDQAIQFLGRSAISVRAALGNSNQEDLKRSMLRYFHRNVSDSTDPTFSLQGLSSAGFPVMLHYDVRFKNAYDPRTQNRFNDTESYLIQDLNLAESANRHFDYVFDGLDYRSDISYRLPDGLLARHTGPALDFTGPFGSLTRTYELADRRVVVKTRLNLPPQVVPVGRVPEFNDFLDALKQSASMWFGYRAVGQGR